MFKIAVFLGLCVAASYGDPVPKRVLCGEPPNHLLSCLKNRPPHIVSSDDLSKCRRNSVTQCDVMTCSFRAVKWIKDEKVDKAKIVAYFNQLGVDMPDWKAAADHVVANCVQQELRPQGVYLNCPAFDIMQCVLTGFIKKAQSSQWSESAECEYPRDFAGACPLCPSECFAVAVPYGSCNACYAQ